MENIKKYYNIYIITMNSMQSRMAAGQAAIRRNPRRTGAVIVVLILITVVCVGLFAPGKIGFIKYLMKSEGHKCGNDENAETQEFNADKECITTCKDGFEENDGVCTKIPDVDCVVGEFGACSLEGENCVKKRTIQIYPSGDGTVCPSLTEDCDQSECQVQETPGARTGTEQGRDGDETGTGVDGEEVIPPPSWCPVGYALKNDDTQTCYATKKELCSANGLGTDKDCSGNFLTCGTKAKNSLTLYDDSKVYCCKPVLRPTWTNPARMTCDAKY